jgi:hypothetical protein
MLFAQFRGVAIIGRAFVVAQNHQRTAGSETRLEL